MAQALGFLPAMETWKEFLAPGFILSQPQLLQPFGGRNQWKRGFSPLSHAAIKINLFHHLLPSLVHSQEIGPEMEHQRLKAAF